MAFTTFLNKIRAFCNKFTHNTHKFPRTFHHLGEAPTHSKKLSDWYNYKRICTEEKELIRLVNRKCISMLFDYDTLSSVKEMSLNEIKAGYDLYVKSNAIPFPGAVLTVKKWYTGLLLQCQVLRILLHIPHENMEVIFELEHTLIKGVMMYDKVRQKEEHQRVIDDYWEKHFYSEAHFG